MTLRDCPPSEDLVSYCLGRLDDHRSESIAAHIEDCPECRAVLETLVLPDDPLTDQLRSPLPADSYAREASCANMIRSASFSSPVHKSVGVDRQSTSTSTGLLNRVRQHDAQAWQRFADLYTPLIYGWARRSGLKDSDAADVAQEVFRTVAVKVDDFGEGREKPSFRGWLAAITRNQVRLYYRKLGSRTEATGGTDAAMQLQNVPGAADQPSDLSVADDRRYLLHRALKLIRDDFEESTWQAFWRTIVDGDSAPEVAAALNMTPGAIRQAKFRVLRRLREEME